MKKGLVIIAMFVTVCGCKNNPVPKPTPVLPPSKTQLILPANNQPCLTGTNITANTSMVTFSWQAANNADKYTLYVKDLITGTTSSQAITDKTATKELLLNVPYSWYVVSASSKITSTAQSDTWKFYNSGPGATDYAPYPADLLTPTYAQQINATSLKVNLSWAVTATSAAIKDYDVYFGTTKDPELFNDKVATTSLSVTVTSKITYYWKIVARDSNGNTSQSQVSTFYVQ